MERTGGARFAANRESAKNQTEKRLQIENTKKDGYREKTEKQKRRKERDEKERRPKREANWRNERAMLKASRWCCENAADSLIKEELKEQEKEALDDSIHILCRVRLIEMKH